MSRWVGAQAFTLGGGASQLHPCGAPAYVQMSMSYRHITSFLLHASASALGTGGGGGGATGTAATHSPDGGALPAAECSACTMPAAGEFGANALFHPPLVAAGQEPMMQPGPRAGGVWVQAPNSCPLHAMQAPPKPPQLSAGLVNSEATRSQACVGSLGRQGAMPRGAL